MKSFFISTALFVTLIAIITANSIYVGRVTEHLLSEADAVSQENFDTERIVHIEEYWSSRKKIIALSTPYRKLDKVDEALISLRCSVESGSADDVLLYRSLLIDALTELKE